MNPPHTRNPLHTTYYTHTVTQHHFSTALVTRPPPGPQHRPPACSRPLRPAQEPHQHTLNSAASVNPHTPRSPQRPLTQRHPLGPQRRAQWTMPQCRRRGAAPASHWQVKQPTRGTFVAAAAQTASPVVAAAPVVLVGAGERLRGSDSEPQSDYM